MSEQEPLLKKIKMADRPPAEWLTAITEAVNGSLDTKFEEFEKKMEPWKKSMEDRLSKMATKDEVDSLAHRISAIETGCVTASTAASTANMDDSNFQPSYVEIKGWCTWKERHEFGKTRNDVETLMLELTAILPESLKPRVHAFNLRGLRNYSVRIPIDKPYPAEIQGIWRQHFKEKNNGTYCTLEPSPLRKTINGTIGKLTSMAEALYEGYKVKTMWAPDYAVYIEKLDTQEPAILIGKVERGNPTTVVWGSTAHTLLGLHKQDLDFKLSQQRQ
eukprot:TRINITY_DN39409_c0_g1_i1.p1 TRINITY_DN39409_c0_g1~~TRINITY_DN39409_c0_g1_i1.p1  ORF type:complete len:275 (+),score=56.31 TRINITY_DN39409_c0_g1_i1:84-908(+)